MTFARAASKCPITVILSGRLTSRPLIPAISQLPIKVAGIADCICSVSTRRYEEEPATRAQQGGKTLSMTGIGDNFRHGSTSATDRLPRKQRHRLFREWVWRAAYIRTLPRNSLPGFSPTCLL